jgi:hypothetical protein
LFVCLFCGRYDSLSASGGGHTGVMNQDSSMLTALTATPAILERLNEGQAVNALAAASRQSSLRFSPDSVDLGTVRRTLTSDTPQCLMPFYNYRLLLTVGSQMLISPRWPLVPR